MKNGTQAILARCADNSSQKFTFASNGEIKIGSNYCLDAYSGKGRKGDLIVIWTCNGGTNQKWTLTSRGELKGINGLCITFGGNPNAGDELYIMTCRTDNKNQKWTPAPTSSSSPSPVPVASVSVSLSATSIGVGQTAQATATLKDANGQVLTGKTVTWASSSPSVASISSSGVITGSSAGTTSITATSEGKSASATLTVTTSGSSSPQPPPSSCSLVTDLTRRSVPSLAKPGYLQWVTEPTFRTSLARITGDPGTAIGSGVSGSWPTVARHDYAKSQPWSADGKLFVLTQLKHAVGAGVQLFLDGETFKPLFARGHPGYEARWHPTLPDVMIYALDNGSVGHWNARTNSATLKFSTTNYRMGLIGPYEGNPSNDGRYLAVTATRKSDGRLVVYVVDLVAGTKSADLDVLAQGFRSADDLDWASVSQGGGYLVLHGDIDGLNQVIKVYDRATLQLRAFWRDHPMGHFDLGIDAAGNEVTFGAASAGPYAKRFLMRRLDNGQVTPLTGPVSWDWHASTRAIRRPGWGLATTNDATGSTFDREVYWVKLDGSGTVERLAHHRTNPTNYDAYPFGVPSPDGRRVAFASNWGGSAVQTYVIDTSSLCK